MSIKAFWSRRDICEAKGTSLSTEKREEKTDPDYPTKVRVSPARIAFPDAEVRRYFETLRSRQIEADEDDRDVGQAGGHESFIRSELVLAARKFLAPDQKQAQAPLILGVDIARGGRDKTRIVDRLGRCAGHACDVTVDSNDLMDVVGRVALWIDKLDPDKVFLDITGLGAGVYDRLRERGYREVVGVNFGSKAGDTDRFANKRAEMWARLMDWLRDEGGADIPDDDEWQASLTAPGYSFDSNSRLLLEPKEKIRERVGFSPDVGDALALTFAETVRPRSAWRHQQPVADSDYDVLRW